eukprot:647438-Prorocentrum_minimum.AAC.1
MWRGLFLRCRRGSRGGLEGDGAAQAWLDVWELASAHDNGDNGAAGGRRYTSHAAGTLSLSPDGRGEPAPNGAKDVLE